MKRFLLVGLVGLSVFALAVPAHADEAAGEVVGTVSVAPPGIIVPPAGVAGGAACPADGVGVVCARPTTYTFDEVLLNGLIRRDSDGKSYLGTISTTGVAGGTANATATGSCGSDGNEDLSLAQGNVNSTGSRGTFSGAADTGEDIDGSDDDINGNLWGCFIRTGPHVQVFLDVDARYNAEVPFFSLGQYGGGIPPAVSDSPVVVTAEFEANTTNTCGDGDDPCYADRNGDGNFGNGDGVTLATFTGTFNSTEA